MHLNIIHLSHRIDRYELFNKEIEKENITEYTIWNGIVNSNIVEKGISLAHKQIVKYAKDEKLNEVLIAEDDFSFTDKGAFKYFLQKKPDDYDLYLSSIYFGILKQDDTVEDFSGLTFYIVHSRFYDIFLSIPEYDNLDRALRGRGRYVVCNPFTVIQHAGFSDNNKEYCNYKSYLNERKLYRST